MNGYMQQDGQDWYHPSPAADGHLWPHQDPGLPDSPRLLQDRGSERRVRASAINLVITTCLRDETAASGISDRSQSPYQHWSANGCDASPWQQQQGSPSSSSQSLLLMQPCHDGFAPQPVVDQKLDLVPAAGAVASNSDLPATDMNEIKYANTKLLGASEGLNQEDFVRALVPGVQTSDIFSFWRPRNATVTKQSLVLTLTEGQLDVMYALACCVGVRFTIASVKTDVRKFIEDVYGIDKNNFSTFFKNRTPHGIKNRTNANRTPTVKAEKPPKTEKPSKRNQKEMDLPSSSARALPPLSSPVQQPMPLHERQPIQQQPLSPWQLLPGQQPMQPHKRQPIQQRPLSHWQLQPGQQPGQPPQPMPLHERQPVQQRTLSPWQLQPGQQPQPMQPHERQPIQQRTLSPWQLQTGQQPQPMQQHERQSIQQQPLSPWQLKPVQQPGQLPLPMQQLVRQPEQQQPMQSPLQPARQLHLGQQHPQYLQLGLHDQFMQNKSPMEHQPPRQRDPQLFGCPQPMQPDMKLRPAQMKIPFDAAEASDGQQSAAMPPPPAREVSATKGAVSDSVKPAAEYMADYMSGLKDVATQISPLSFQLSLVQPSRRVGGLVAVTGTTPAHLRTMLPLVNSERARLGLALSGGMLSMFKSKNSCGMNTMWSGSTTLSLQPSDVDALMNDIDDYTQMKEDAAMLAEMQHGRQAIGVRDTLLAPQASLVPLNPHHQQHLLQQQPSLGLSHSLQRLLLIASSTHQMQEQGLQIGCVGTPLTLGPCESLRMEMSVDKGLRMEMSLDNCADQQLQQQLSYPYASLGADGILPFNGGWMNPLASEASLGSIFGMPFH